MKPKPEVSPITQSELAVIERLRNEKVRLSSTLREVEAQLAANEKSVLDRLADGARIQRGDLRPFVDEKRVCSPSYKEELIEHFEHEHGIAGKLVEEQVKSRWTSVKKFLGIAHRVDAKKLGVVH